MPWIEPILWHAAPFLLVATRLGGLFVLTPVLANRGIPMRGRALLVLVLAAALYPTVPAASQSPAPVSLLMLAPMIVSELLVGLVMGFIAAIPIMALDLAGLIAGHQMGLGLARVYNPDADVDTDLLGQLLMYLGLGVFLALGGLEAAFTALARSFADLPPGSLAITDLPLTAMLSAITGGFELALRVAAPAVGMILLLLIAMGFVMKTMPQINVLSVGFAVQAFFGLLVLAASLPAVQQAATDGVRSGLARMSGWTASVAASRAASPPEGP